MLETFITILGLACLTNLFVHSGPMIYLRMWLFGAKDRWWINLMECAMCSGFWIGLIFTWNLYLACIISILAEFISRKINGNL